MRHVCGTQLVALVSHLHLCLIYDGTFFRHQLPSHCSTAHKPPPFFRKTMMRAAVLCLCAALLCATLHVSVAYPDPATMTRQQYNALAQQYRALQHVPSPTHASRNTAAVSCPARQASGTADDESARPVAKFVDTNVHGTVLDIEAASYLTGTEWKLKLTDSCGRVSQYDLTDKAQTCGHRQYIQRPTPCDGAAESGNDGQTQVDVHVDARIFVSGGTIEFQTPYGPLTVPRDTTSSQVSE